MFSLSSMCIACLIIDCSPGGSVLCINKRSLDCYFKPRGVPSLLTTENNFPVSFRNEHTQNVTNRLSTFKCKGMLISLLAMYCGLTIRYRYIENIRQLMCKAADLSLVPVNEVEEVWFNALE